MKKSWLRLKPFAPSDAHAIRQTDAVTALYLEFARALSSLSVPRVVPDDPDDDHVVACAVAARVDVIVSGDKHLLKLREYQGIRMVTAAQAVKSFTKA
jgi:predicted nucleic acid-binding protein